MSKTVIEMAREAGLLGPYDTEQDIVECGIEVWLSGERGMKALERFAEIVRADEREKVARWQIGSGYATGHGDTIEDLLVELEWQVREAEREACARIAEEPSATTYECTVACGGPAQTFTQRMPKDAHDIAKQIRARGQA